MFAQQHTHPHCHGLIRGIHHVTKKKQGSRDVVKPKTEFSASEYIIPLCSFVYVKLVFIRKLLVSFLIYLVLLCVMCPQSCISACKCWNKSYTLFIILFFGYNFHLPFIDSVIRWFVYNTALFTIYNKLCQNCFELWLWMGITSTTNNNNNKQQQKRIQRTSSPLNTLT